jgi:hypothetical protein
MWSPSRSHHDQIGVPLLRLSHYLAVNVVSGRNDETQDRRLDVVRERRCKLFFTVSVVSAVKQNQFGLMGTRQRHRITHGIAGVWR